MTVQKNIMEVKKMRKTKSVVFSSFLLLILSTTIPTVAITQAFGKNMNLPPGANGIEYLNAGGQVEIPLPPLPSSSLPNYPSSATAIRFSFAHVEIPNADSSYDTLLVWLYLIPTGSPGRVWSPYAYITTNAGELTFLRTFWRGSFIEFDATLFGQPSTGNTDNIMVVSGDVLKVDRHGNDVSVSLNSPQQVRRPLVPIPPGPLYFTLPAFSLKLSNYGGSMHFMETTLLTGYPGASGYKMVNEGMGFAANGALTSPTTWLNGAQVQNATVIMNGIHTFYPPT